MLFAYIMYKQSLSEWKRAVHATQQTIQFIYKVNAVSTTISVRFMNVVRTF